MEVSWILNIGLKIFLSPKSLLSEGDEKLACFFFFLFFSFSSNSKALHKRKLSFFRSIGFLLGEEGWKKSWEKKKLSGRFLKTGNHSSPEGSVDTKGFT